MYIYQLCDQSRNYRGAYGAPHHSSGANGTKLTQYYPVTLGGEAQNYQVTPGAPKKMLE